MPTSHVLEQGEAGFRQLLNQYRQSARQRSIEFGLTREKFRALTSQPCSYCGAEPEARFVPSGRSEEAQRHGTYVYSGVDRTDNDLGYTEKNCVPCCSVCNYRKKASDKDEFLGWIRKVYEHSFGR